MTEPRPDLEGRLVVATPGLRDPNFARTVVLLLAHGAEGALGVVLNRPGSLPVAEVLPTWAELAAPPAVVFAGGPVEPSAAICLGARPGGWVTVDVDAEPMSSGVTAVRLFAAYAGWGGGQLEAEMAAGGWYALDALPDDPFTADPLRLWPQVLRRQGGTIALGATCPEDVRMN